MARRASPLILVVDDDQAHRLMLVTMLDEWGYRVAEASDGRKAIDAIHETPVDLILMDMRMPNLDGIEAAKEITRYNPAIPIVIMTAYSSVETAVDALKSGVFDYITKPINFDALKIAMDHALEHTRLKQENEGLKSQLSRLQAPGIIGGSPAMQRVIEMIGLVAPSEATVLITGESGCGKGLVARAIHENSSRSDKPLVEVNCAAIPEALIESELFGHEKGAFTGADRQRRGRFSLADGGALFLDEVGELPVSVQAKLLRVLQEGDIQRVGSDAYIPVDVRIIAATNRNLEKMVAEGLFREDLFYRLNVIAVEVPPLRERIEDIPILAQHFWKLFAEKNHKSVKGVTPGAMDLLLRHPWPGNVRELENVMERAVILLQGEYISERELPISIQKMARGREGDSGALQSAPGLQEGEGTLAEAEKRLILQALHDAGGNKSEASRRLGITRRTLKLKLKKYDEEEGSQG